MTTGKAKRFAGKARRIFRARERGSAQYAIGDRILRQMRDAGMKHGDVVTINTDGDQAELVDNYAESDKVFRAHGISRYELKLLDANGKPKRN